MEKSPYYGIQAISNTALSYINPEEKGCPQKFFDFLENKLEQKESKAMLTGSLIHARILEPETISVIMLPKISDTVREIVDRIAQTLDLDFIMVGTDLSSYKEEILAVAQEIGYGQSWKPDTLIKKVCEEGGNEYFNMLLQNVGKTIVSADVFAKLLKVESAIKSNPAACSLFFNEPSFGVEYFHEREILWKYGAMSGTVLDCKSKLDLLIVNHEDCTFRIVDLKTTSESVEMFPKLFKDRRIYRQLAFYEMAAGQWLNTLYPDRTYTPEQHSVLVAETEGYNRVRRFDVAHSFIVKGRQEVASLMARIDWHIETNERLNSYEDVLSEFSFLIEEDV